MTSKKLISLTAVAAVLIVLAVFTSTRNRVRPPSRQNKPVFESIDLSRVAAIEIENGTVTNLTLRSTDSGWVVDALHGYPADVARIREAVLKLDQLKVGHAGDASRLGDNPGRVVFKDASDNTLATLHLGTKRMREADPAMAAYGGGARSDGRYIAVNDDPTALLVSDALEAFDADAKRWINTQIVSVPSSEVSAVTIEHAGETLSLTKTNGVWTLNGLAENETLDPGAFQPIESALSYLNLTDVVDPARTAGTCGLTTGTVFTATLKDGISYTAKVGNTVDNGTDRYVQLNAAFAPVGTNETVNAAAQEKVDAFNTGAGSWTFTLSSYNADRLRKTRDDFLKPAETDEEEEADDDADVEASETTDEAPDPIGAD